MPPRLCAITHKASAAQNGRRAASASINVNCVLPTTLDTPQKRANMPTNDPTRWVAPDALAEVIVFLASDAARAVHGAAVLVTGLSQFRAICRLQSRCT